MALGRRFLILIAGLSLAVHGCSQEAKISRPVAPISGTIKLNGRPIEGATVTFIPVSTGGGNLPSSFGKTDRDGKYTLEVITNGRQGAVIGQHNVRINHPDDDVPAGKGRDIEDAGNAALKRARRIPERYAHGDQFKFEVTEGGASDADFEMKAP